MLYKAKTLFFFFTMLSLSSKSYLQNNIFNINASVYDSTLNAFGMAYVNISFGLQNDTAVIETKPGANIVQIQIQNGDWEEILSDAPIIVGENNYKMPASTQIIQYLDLFPLYINSPNKYKSIFEQGGEIRFRYCFYIIDGNADNQYVFSNILTLNTLPLDSANAAAFNFILQKTAEFPELKGFTSIFRDYTTYSVLPIYDDLVQNFPNTILGQIAKARLAFNKCGDHNFEALPANIKSQVQQVYDELNTSSVIPIKKILEDLQECLTN